MFHHVHQSQKPMLLTIGSIWYEYCSVAKSCPTPVTPWTAACQASLSFTMFWSLLRLISIESMMPFNHLILCCLLLLLSSIFPSIRVFSNESALYIRWPKYWSFSISPSNKYPGSTYFRIDWFGLFDVQRTLKSLLQHHSSKASVIWHAVFFMVQISHPHMTTGKTIALSIGTFVGKIIILKDCWLLKPTSS